jgi:hypothetical protein
VARSRSRTLSDPAGEPVDLADVGEQLGRPTAHDAMTIARKPYLELEPGPTPRVTRRDRGAGPLTGNIRRYDRLRSLSAIAMPGT